MSEQFYELYHGDCLEILSDIDDDSIDTVITDPPYGLSKEPDMAEVLRHWLAGDDYEHRGGGFMGKSWDSFVPGPAIWKEVYRVMKPGACLMAFGGTRTNDLLSVAIRMVGFRKFDEIDYYYGGLPPQIAWVYGQGFPKSHAIGKAIDKAAIVPCPDCNGTGENQVVRWDEWIAKTKDYGGTHEEWVRLHGSCTRCDGTGRIKGAEREVVGHKAAGATAFGQGSGWNPHNNITKPTITAPSTDAAALWEGYGTALKPAHEVILCFYKPREGTYANNALRWNVAGLWVDGGRIGSETLLYRSRGAKGLTDAHFAHGDRPYEKGLPNRNEPITKAQGRWPTNLILSHAPECRLVGTKKVKGQGPTISSPTAFGLIDDDSWEPRPTYHPGQADKDGKETVEDWECVPWCPVRLLDEQSGTNTRIDLRTNCESGDSAIWGEDNKTDTRRVQDLGGGASRFFYTAKSSSSERNEGCEDLYWRKQGKTFIQISKKEWSSLPSKQRAEGNVHATVKPLGLMRYLTRLTRTPSGGTVLDPFMGSGSEGVACIEADRSFIGIEIEEASVVIAEARMEHAWLETE